ncbi:hypothetical protein ARMSODRAFT_37138 [Armillaria solidipes]|uniref:Uncharacterized protein n=1 Tax=Armillaria solidipes TaxID=1076256 RepID=A0A2H3CQF3_9AGAR|nr:hypothetical protein ARMSODRAFT_37138 [Armillaria solidipes]
MNPATQRSEENTTAERHLDTPQGEGVTAMFQRATQVTQQHRLRQLQGYDTPNTQLDSIGILLDTLIRFPDKHAISCIGSLVLIYPTMGNAIRTTARPSNSLQVDVEEEVSLYTWDGYFECTAVHKSATKLRRGIRYLSNQRTS